MSVRSASDTASTSLHRIAMWSGPRNISTAMMRAWDARPDTVVCDEPLYAHYLDHTGLDHPGAAEIIAHHDADWRAVAAWLTTRPSPDADIFYQKHMAHHLLPHIERDWTSSLTNCFLIRTPHEMLVSLAKVLPEVRLEDTGLPQQLDLFRRECERLGQAPPVLDARDVLTDPAGLLSALCERIGVPYTAAMLSWSAGTRDTDGIWARHWYAAVEQSTGFAPYVPRTESLPTALKPLLDPCQQIYDELAAYRILSETD